VFPGGQGPPPVLVNAYLQNSGKKRWWKLKVKKQGKKKDVPASRLSGLKLGPPSTAE
jgi:hypothetical protein